VLSSKPHNIENHQKFLSLWEDADPGIAEIRTLTEDAKKGLDGLKSSQNMVKRGK
jgi:hypothetical protein